MTVLVTGANGFLGRHLVRHLSDGGHRVVALVRPGTRISDVPWETVEIDLAASSLEGVLEGGVDAVVHLAQSRHHRSFPTGGKDLFQVNVQSTYLLALEALRVGVRRFIFSSTTNVYGGGGPNSEEMMCNPSSAYAATKLAAERLLAPFSQLGVTILRVAGLFGRDQTDALVPGIIARIENGVPVDLREGVGLHLNPLFVDDAVRALTGVLCAPGPAMVETLNFGSRSPVTLAQLAGTLAAEMGRDLVSSEPPGRALNLVGNTARFSRKYPGLLDGETPVREALGSALR